MENLVLNRPIKAMAKKWHNTSCLLMLLVVTVHLFACRQNKCTSKVHPKPAVTLIPDNRLYYTLDPRVNKFILDSIQSKRKILYSTFSFSDRGNHQDLFFYCQIPGRKINSSDQFILEHSNRFLKIGTMNIPIFSPFEIMFNEECNKLQKEEERKKTDYEYIYNLEYDLRKFRITQFDSSSFDPKNDKD